MARVLRLQPGDEILLCNGEGIDFNATIQEIGKRSLSLKITDSVAAVTEASKGPTLTLIQGLPKGEKFDLIIQKATELGIHSIVAFPAAHSVVKISKEQEECRISRWNKIAAEASRQSERRCIPTITLAKNLDTALRGVTDSVKLFLWEREANNHLRTILPGAYHPASLVILVGPEGGFSADEVSLAKAYDCIPVSLGPRILRTETASLAILSILQYQFGDMG
jgi:16S rRNA (uracil1498-N3)-methyltransferase